MGRTVGDAGTTADEVVVHETAHFPLELQATRIFVQTGSIAATAKQLGVPMAQIRAFSKTIWWQDEVAALQRDIAAQLDANLTRVLDFTLEALLDRVTNGDVVLVKGAEKRVRMKAATLAQVASVVFDKRQLVRNMPTAIAGDTQKLNVLAQKLRALGAKDITILENGDASTQEG